MQLSIQEDNSYIAAVSTWNGTVVFRIFFQIIMILIVLCPTLFWTSMKCIIELEDRKEIDAFGRRTMERIRTDKSFSLASRFSSR